MPENRFKKSVDQATSNTLANILDNTTDNILTNTTDNIFTNIKTNILTNILNNEPQKKDTGKNHTFYLSPDVSTALTKLAKKTKQSKSKLVNEILRNVLAEGYK
jgi:hypothetical protein